jgi:hypothetical protein
MHRRRRLPRGEPDATQLIVDFFGYFAQPLATTAPPSSAAASSGSGSAEAKVRAQPLR